MHSAPSVSHPVGRSRLAGVLVGAGCIAVAAALAGWWAEGATGWRLAAIAVAGAAAISLAACGWLSSPCGTLSWDGAGWALDTARGCERGSLVATLDLQRLLLVRLAATRGTQWIWLERGTDDAAWHALRRAVYSRATHDALHGASGPAATP